MPKNTRKPAENTLLPTTRIRALKIKRGKGGVFNGFLRMSLILGF